MSRIDIGTGGQHRELGRTDKSQVSGFVNSFNAHDSQCPDVSDR